MSRLDTFISFSHKDKALADAVLHYLESKKLKCWIASRDIAPAENWAAAISRAIPECKIFLLIFSEDANMSQQVLREVELAVKNNIPILTVKVDDIMPTEGLDYYLSTVHWLDVVDKKVEAYLDKLYDDLVNILKNGRRFKPAPEKKKQFMRILLFSGVFVIILAGILIAVFWGSIFKAQPKEEWNLLVDLEFNNEEDMSWVMENDKADSYELAEGQLQVKQGCNIDYELKPGMLVHYKVKLPKHSSVGTFNFRLNSEINFESVYYLKDEETNHLNDFSSKPIQLEGHLFKNNGQYIDAVVFLNDNNSIVYIVAIDDNAGDICFISYKLSEALATSPQYLEVNNFTDGDSIVVIDSVKLAKGSLRRYIEDNFNCYKDNKDLVDEFLERDYDDIEELVFSPVSED